MSDNIPFEMQEEIMKRFPVKSLIQFRSASKAWKSLIDSAPFIAAHRVLHAHSHRLLVNYVDLAETETKYVSIVDDDTFPQQNFATVPLYVNKLLIGSKVVGSSDGLFCLSGGYYNECGDSLKKMAVLWNPTIRKSIDIAVPAASYDDATVLGFGVCPVPVTSDPKILMAGRCRPFNPDHVKVFSLSSGAWRSPTINLPYILIYLHDSQVVIDRFIYWLVSDRYAIDGGENFSNNLIISFDLTNDEFGEVHLPDNLSLNSSVIWSSKIRETLALIEEVNKQCFYVWMMEDSDSKSFVKVFTIAAPFASLCLDKVFGFRRNTDEPILKVAKGSDSYSSFFGTLAVYEPLSQQIHYPEIIGLGALFSVFSYTETLLLLNQR